MNRAGRAALAMLAAAAAALAGCGPDAATLERQARTLVYEKLSLPDQPVVVVGPAVTASDFAIVDWTRGAFAGGRTLLRRENGAWTMVLCGGQPLRRRPIIEREGRVPDIAAGVLITKLWREEGHIDQARRDQLDRWTSLPATVTCPEARG